MLKIFKEGYYENTYDYDAYILQKIIGGLVIKTAKGPRLGYLTKNRNDIIKQLIENQISFVVMNNNITEEQYTALNDNYETMLKSLINKEIELNKTLTPKEILISIIDGKDPYSSTSINGLGEKTISKLQEILSFLSKSNVSNYVQYITEPWGFDEQKLLLELHNNNVSVDEISKQFNRSPSDINTMLIKLGAKQKQYPNPPTYNKPKPTYYNSKVVEIGDTVTILNLNTDEEITKTIIQSIIQYKPKWLFDRSGKPKELGYETKEISRADLSKGEISHTSPLAQAILGKKENDLFSFTVENKTIKGKILKVN